MSVANAGDGIYTTVDACDYYQALLTDVAGAECGEEAFAKCTATQVLATAGMAAHISVLVVLGCSTTSWCKAAFASCGTVANALLVIVSMFWFVALGAGYTAIWSLGES